MLLQAIFTTDLEGIFYVTLIIAVVVILNRLISYILGKLNFVTKKMKIYVGFLIQLATFGIIAYLILNGIPYIYQYISNNPTQVAVFTGSISIAIAFASSGIFSNLVSGFMLFSLKPFEVGDLIKIDGETGVVRTINLTTTIIETFDNILVEKANNDVISTEIVNYTVNIDEIKSFIDFKKEIHYSEAPLPPEDIQKSSEDYELRLKNVFKTVIKRGKKSKLYNYLFPMEFPYEGFHKLITEVEKICKKFTKTFGFKPLYHIYGFDNYIKLNFRILTFNSSKIFNEQPKFAKEIYSLIFRHYIQNKET
jgi:small-conductance mechanosensitive channel